MNRKDSFMARIGQLNTWVIIGLVGVLLGLSIVFQQILDSTYISTKLVPMVDFLGRITNFFLFVTGIVMVVNYLYSSLLKVSRTAFYNDTQRDELIKILKDPACRTDYDLFKKKVNEKVTQYPNYLSEVVGSILPTALAQPFVLEQYFNAKIDNISKRYSDAVNSINLMSNVGPYLGFLGTLLGLMKAFEESALAFEIHKKMTVDSFLALQRSIMIAVITSLFGVAIKILGSILKHHLMVKSARFSEELAEIPREVMYERRMSANAPVSGK
jgi:biopolymer transport protein ExbB/TolQ